MKLKFELWRISSNWSLQEKWNPTGNWKRFIYENWTVFVVVIILFLVQIIHFTPDFWSLNSDWTPEWVILTQAETTLILFWVIWFQSFFNKIWCAGNFHHNIWSIRTDIIEVVLLEVLWSFVTKSFKLMGEGLGKILLFAPLSVIIFNDFVHWVELFAMPLLFNLLR